MNDPRNRTFVCSVLFVDLVEYSKRSVAEQMQLKQKFNAMLEQSLESVAVTDRIVLDTGDGAAVTFLGNPEDALYAGISLRSAIAEEGASPAGTLAVRTGINLGAVRLIKDLNGQLNIIGDAINVAQRVMGFAEPGQILVSRSYYEVIHRLDPQFEQLFKYEGARTDKHVREHEIYAVGTGAGPFMTPVRAHATPDSKPDGRRTRMDRLRRMTFNARIGIALPATMALIVAAGIVVRAQRAPAVLEEDVYAAGLAVPGNPRTAERRTRSDVGATKPDDTVATQRQVRREAADKKARRASERDGSMPAPGAEGVAAAQLLIVPWGEVIVDGQRRGVSPPLRVLELNPGEHKIEIRNGEFPAYTQQVSLRAGERLTIRHRFN